ncbi:enoyl-CoA hydratase/isomerase family protein [Shouchella patagoniensis]|uniref:enoyl-CoA hydratase/isomerase family protein n=1 Tax=Shouchella patagoniensis TaxID=228576 RepID=UPI000995624D|nr:enoyl-CoA hydratase/isomerase family protein [Shouchella patagoniensis]
MPKTAARYIEIDFPENKNAFNLEMATFLLNSIEEAELDPECYVIVFKSNQRACFSSGPRPADLINMIENEGTVQIGEIISVFNQVLLKIAQSRKFTIAAIHGYAYGGGFNLMLPCDYRIAVERTKFIENFYEMGITPDLGASYFLPEILGFEKSLHLLLLEGLFTGKEALEWGLIHETAPTKKEMMEKVETICNKLIRGLSKRIIETKEILKTSGKSTLEDQLVREKQAILLCFEEKAVQERLKRTKIVNEKG